MIRIDLINRLILLKTAPITIVLCGFVVFVVMFAVGYPPLLSLILAGNAITFAVFMIMPSALIGLRANKQLRLVPNFNLWLALVCALWTVFAALVFAAFWQQTGKSEASYFAIFTYFMSVAGVMAVIAPRFTRNMWGVAAYYVIASALAPVAIVYWVLQAPSAYTPTQALIVALVSSSIWIIRLKHSWGVAIPNISTTFVNAMTIDFGKQRRDNSIKLFDYKDGHKFSRRNRLWGLVVDGGPESKLLAMGIATPLLIIVIHMAILQYTSIDDTAATRMIAMMLIPTTLAPFFAYWATTVLPVVQRSRLACLRVGGDIDSFWVELNRFVVGSMIKWLPLTCLGWLTVILLDLNYASKERIIIIPISYIALFITATYASFILSKIGKRWLTVIGELTLMVIGIGIATITVSEAIWAQLPYSGAVVVSTLLIAAALSYRHAKNLFIRNTVFI